MSKSSQYTRPIASIGQLIGTQEISKILTYVKSHRRHQK